MLTRATRDNEVHVIDGVSISRIVGNNRILIAVRRCILFSVQLFESTDEYIPFLADFNIR